MQQEFIGHESLAAELSQRGKSLVTDSSAAVNRNSLLTRWKTVDAQIKVLFAFIFCHVVNVHACVLAYRHYCASCLAASLISV